MELNLKYTMFTYIFKFIFSIYKIEMLKIYSDTNITNNTMSRFQDMTIRRALNGGTYNKWDLMIVDGSPEVKAEQVLPSTFNGSKAEEYYILFDTQIMFKPNDQVEIERCIPRKGLAGYIGFTKKKYKYIPFYKLFPCDLKNTKCVTIGCHYRERLPSGQWSEWQPWIFGICPDTGRFVGMGSVSWVTATNEF